MSDMLIIRTKRASNFTESEKDILLQLVEKYVRIVECKKTDATTNKYKEAAWKKIAIEFNAVSDQISRDAKVLRLKYENIKKTLKRKIGNNKVKLLTGNKQATLVSIPPTEDLLQTVDGVQINRPTFPFDKANEEVDDMYNNTSTLTVESDVQFEMLEDTPNNADRSSWNSSVLKKETSKELLLTSIQDNSKPAADVPQMQRSKSRRHRVEIDTSRTKFDAMSEAKLTLMKLQIELCKAERKRKEEYAEVELQWLNRINEAKEQSIKLDIEIKKLELQKLQHDVH